MDELSPRGQKIGLSGLNPPALARLVSRLMDGPFSGQCILILTPTAIEAEDLAGDLSFFWPQGRVELMPGVETKPFLGQQVGSEAMADRLRALYTLATSGPSTVVVASANAALRLVPEPNELLARSLTVSLGDEAGFANLTGYLAKNGYNIVGQVETVADYSVKGGIVDVYPPGLDRPVRIDFFGDFIDSIKPFRVDDQKSSGLMDSLTLVPASEGPRDKQSLEKGAGGLAHLAEKNKWLWLLWEPIARRLKEGMASGDLDDWSPLWAPRTATVLDYIPKGPLILLEPGRLREATLAASRNLGNHFDRLAHEERPHLELSYLYANADQLFDALNAPGRSIYASSELHFSEKMALDAVIPFACETNSDLKALTSVPRRSTGLLGPLAARVKALLGRDLKVNLVLRTREQLKRLAGLLIEYDLAPTQGPSGRRVSGANLGSLDLTIGQLSAGFVAPYDNEAFLSEDEILGTRQRLRRRAREEFRGLKGFASLKDLAPGDFAVHNEHGIGQYLGLVTLVLSTGQKGDFLHLSYRGGDFLYVPVERFSSVTKYVGATDRPPTLDRLGTSSWEKVKGKVKENIRQMAEDLLKLYAARQTAPGHSFGKRDQAMMEFEAAFQYEPTADQERSIDEVLNDLGAPKPMDRLVCGDVGYGKTEVAMRAAFKVVNEGKQVAILVPTTILCEQHERSFIERFNDWPVKVASISRFKKPAMQKLILEGLAKGSIDIIIGTHRLLQRDVIFKDLGLLVIDEEHRFGVADKEKLKKYRSSVDVLSMSATPIPRSLSMSMNGIRDMSIIETSPQDRLAVKTSLIARNDEAIVEAIDRELARGGQVFLVHNRVRDINLWVENLQHLMPLTRFGVGHGQMSANELETVMGKFLNHEIDVWITTTIVESGLDFPSANTIIIDQADRYGLAQLYQLRGRVGRGHLQAYCYLMVDDPDILTDDARKRLKALLDHTDLGSGYQIALHDLQIRGSGNILGAAQSGQASLVGYEMYSQLMEQTIRELKNETWLEDYEPEVVIGLPAYLPSVYVPDTEVRLVLYRRLAAAATMEEVAEIAEEMKDRMGEPPMEAKNLINLMEIKILLKKTRARRLEVGQDGLTVTFGQEGPADYEKVLAIVSGTLKNKLTPAGRLSVVRAEYMTTSNPMKWVRDFLLRLA
jgi:transcription-repair coupling factor (superfamily II helicase)